MSGLNEDQIVELRSALLQSLTECETFLAEGADAAKPVDLDEPIGRLSRMDAIQQQQMARAARAALSLRLQQIKAALSAIRGDRYGECRRCEEAIGFSRLCARPEAPFCMECQQEIESRT